MREDLGKGLESMGFSVQIGRNMESWGDRRS